MYRTVTGMTSDVGAPPTYIIDITPYLDLDKIQSMLVQGTLDSLGLILEPAD